jgi:hypothetical protein
MLFQQVLKKNMLNLVTASSPVSRIMGEYDLSQGLFLSKKKEFVLGYA